MRFVYVATKFRDVNPWRVYQNSLAAERGAAEVLLCQQLMPIAPHTLTRNLDPLASEEFWLQATRELMERCDAVYVVPDWETSVGTLGEIRRALYLGRPVFFGRERLRLYGALWAEAQKGDWVDLSPIVKTNCPWHPERIDNPQGNDACARIEHMVLRDFGTTLQFTLLWRGEKHQDFGTMEWAIETISCMRSNGTLPGAPPVLIEWLDAKMVSLERKKAGLE